MKTSPYPYARPPLRPHCSTEAPRSPDDQIPPEAEYYMDEGQRLRAILDQALRDFLVNRARESRYYSDVVAEDTGTPHQEVSDDDLSAVVDQVIQAHGFTVSYLAERLLEPGLEELFRLPEEFTPEEPLARAVATLPQTSSGWSRPVMGMGRLQLKNQRLYGRQGA